MNFNKVRAIIENNKGELAISSEGGKLIFPGGKVDKGEDIIAAIKRELLEETGISFETHELEKVLELETFYDDFYDYRSKSIKPRHTVTTYFFAKTDKQIILENLRLTEGEIKENFKIKFVDKKSLFDMLSIDHSKEENGKFFDEENKIVVNSVLKK
jgi:8-oxo-dGTP pyrophosphatase MutT (NUDIX family)